MNKYVAFITFFVAVFCTISVHGQKCVKKGKEYEVTNKWFIIDCKEKCRCRKGGVLKCRRLCRTTVTPKCAYDEVPEVFRLKRRQGCYCNITRCVKRTSTKPREDYCIGPDRVEHRKGALFIPKDCTQKCHCLDNPVDGKTYKCEPLCPKDDLNCKYYEEIERYTESVSGDCSCTRRRCTSRKTGCHGSDNRFYPFGVKFVVDDCSGECICRSRDSIIPECTGTVCPYMWVQCAYGEELDYYNKTFPGSACVCRRVRCKRENCYYQPDGKLYPLGKDFITQDCYRCRCRDDGGYDCNPLCQNSDNCGQDEEVFYQKYKVENTNCECQRAICKKRTTCVGPDGGKYPMEKEWIPGDCSGRCRCRPNGLGYNCDGLCPRTRVCGTNKKPVYREYYLENTRCKCSRLIRCDSLAKATCLGPDGRNYPIGRVWIPTDCSGQCRCRPNGFGYNCDALCPLTKVCKVNENPVYEEYRLENSNCKCQRVRCERKATCLASDGRSYPIGVEFIPEDCSGRCRCRQNGFGYDCDGLCEAQSINCGWQERVDYDYYEYVQGTRCQCRKLRCIPRSGK